MKTWDDVRARLKGWQEDPSEIEDLPTEEAYKYAYQQIDEWVSENMEIPNSVTPKEGGICFEWQNLRCTIFEEVPMRKVEYER